MRSRALRVRWGNDRERRVVNRALGAADARHWTDTRNALEWVPERRPLGRRPDPSARSRDGARTNDGCRRGRRTEHPVLVWRPRANVTGCGGRRGAPGRPARDDRERLVGGCGSARRGAGPGGLRLRRRIDATGRCGGRRRNGRGGRSRGHRLADRLRRHRRRRRRRGRRRQELQRIGIPLRLGCDADAQMDVRLSDLDLTGGTDGGNGLPVDDGRVLGDFDRPEVGQRHGVPVGRDDRQALARGRDGAREGDRPGRGRRPRDHPRPPRCRDRGAARRHTGDLDRRRTAGGLGRPPATSTLPLELRTAMRRLPPRTRLGASATPGSARTRSRVPCEPLPNVCSQATVGAVSAVVKQGYKVVTECRDRGRFSRGRSGGRRPRRRPVAACRRRPDRTWPSGRRSRPPRRSSRR